MKGIVAQIEGKYAVILTQEGMFKKVRALPGMTVGMETELSQMKGGAGTRRIAARTASMAAAGLLALGVGFGAYSYCVPYSYVDIDINPSIELAVNIYDRIIAAEALNEDGEKLLMDKDLRHKKLDAGVRELLNGAVEQGYLEAGNGNADGTGAQAGDDRQTENSGQVSGDGGRTSDGGPKDTGNASVPSDGDKDPKRPAAPNGNKTGAQAGKEVPGRGPAVENAVMVTVTSSNAKKSGELKKKIADTASNELEKGKVSSEILVGEASDAQRKEARQLGVTPGKLTLIEDVLRHLPDKELEDVKNTAVKELIEIAGRSPKDIRKEKAAPGLKDAETVRGDKTKDEDKGGTDSNVNNDDRGSSKGNTAAVGKTGKTDKDPGRIAPNKNGGAGVGSKPSADKTQSGSDKHDAGNKGGRNDMKSIDDRKENQSRKENEDIRKVLEKSGEELKKEREKLKDELLGQVESKRDESRDSAGKEPKKNEGTDHDKAIKNDKDEKQKKQNSSKKDGTENDSRNSKDRKK
jgi:hypothetical protein